MIICPNCNAQLADGSTFCTVCGMQFAQNQPGGYAQQGYDPNGYAQQGYDPNGYQQQGYDPNGYPQQSYAPNGYGQQGMQQPYGYGQYDAQQAYQQPAQPKKGKGKLIAMIAVALVVLAGIGTLAQHLFRSQGYGVEGGSSGGSAAVSPNQGGSGNSGSSGDAKPTNVLSGNDVFQGQRYDEMLWGYYELENYKYTGSRDDTAQFLEGMKYRTVTEGDREYTLSVLPVTIQMGSESHFLGAFSYEDELYMPYTELGRSMFRKAYMEQYGDLEEADFQKLEYILNLKVAHLSVAMDNGNLYQMICTYKIEGNMLLLYDVDVDEQYNVVTSEKPVLQYEFLHDGGKLMLACEGVQRNYYTDGYKDTDPSLSFSGYALNDNQQYGDLEGFYFSQYGVGEKITVYPQLSGGETPVDPQMTLDNTTGSFTLSWTQRWVEEERGLSKLDDPTTITGTIIPCTSYGFTDYTGFIMIIDGQQYRYLMSQEEYDERRFAGLSENLSDSQKEEMVNTKRSILEELDEAFRAAGIQATVDYDNGKISLEANFLFATNSYELSQEGQTYLDTFVDVYASVVLKEDYSAQISKVVVEGHTDTSGKYSYNLKLSQNRADAVAQRCIDRNSKMAAIIEAVGCSYDYPVYNEDGTVNMAASRRVTFQFVFAE